MENNEIIDLRKISVYNLLANPSKYLSKEKKYMLICEHGIQSKKTSEILNKMGYYTYSMRNGISDKKTKKD